MKRILIISAVTAAAAILGLRTITDYKREKEIRDRIRWLHARCDGYDQALEVLFDGESGAF